MNRRFFVKGACLGTASLIFEGISAKAQELYNRPAAPSVSVHGLPIEEPSPLGMPGLFPGRVVEVVDSNSIAGNRVSQPVIRRMLELGMKQLTGESSAEEAWRRFLHPTDVVGIKINPSGAPACCSSPEIVREVIRALESIGVPLRNIVVFDRYSYEIDMGSYQTLLPAGIRVVGIEDGAFDVSGYDMQVYSEANFFGEWETRSYMARMVAREFTKIINLPTAKDHSASGVTGCLKNLGYGTFNNVARSHREPYTYTDPFIGMLCTAEPLRSKSVLHIMDGMRMIWHGGPLTQLQNFILEGKTLFLGTDPVAVDSVELETIDKIRREHGAPSVWDHDPKSLTADPNEFYHDPRKNLFYRQPGHIAAAGKLGLGISDLKKIDRRRLHLD
jgi:uncharacterized protein (DUF362 family)